MVRYRKLLCIAAASIMLVGAYSDRAHAIAVALELSLVVDESGSVDSGEMALQLGGYVSAFNDPVIQAEIEALAGSGGIAVNMFSFSTTPADVTERIGWTQITTAAEATAFAAAIQDLIDNDTLGTIGSTNIAVGINTAHFSITGNGFEGDRLVIDVSGDGKQNVNLAGDASVTEAVGITVLETARDNAVNDGIIVNGVAIGADFADLGTYYSDHVASAGGFALFASGFEDFENAISTKIEAEITGETPIPEPGVLLILAFGLAGLGVYRRIAL